MPDEDLKTTKPPAETCADATRRETAGAGSPGLRPQEWTPPQAQVPELLETMLFVPGHGLRHRQRHLRRLQDSARALGLNFMPSAVRTMLDHHVSRLHERRMIRLLLQANGSFFLSERPAPAPLPLGHAMRIVVARSVQVRSSDPLLRHKTTLRELFDRALAEARQRGADEAILLNERGECTEGSFTSLFLRMPGESTLRTPPLRCGLLPGVLRGVLLENGMAREAVVSPRHLRQAEALFIGNSARGLLPARLADG